MPVLPIDALSPIASVEAGTSYSTQCVKVPEGASGSSQMTAMLFDCAGTPLNSSGGGTSCPSQVYFFGMAAPSANTDELTLSAIMSLRSGRVSIEDEGDLQVDLVTDDLPVLHFCRFLRGIVRKDHALPRSWNAGCYPSKRFKCLRCSNGAISISSTARALRKRLYLGWKTFN